MSFVIAGARHSSIVIFQMNHKTHSSCISFTQQWMSLPLTQHPGQHGLSLVLLLFLTSLFFFKERQKGVDPETRSGEKLE